MKSSWTKEPPKEAGIYWLYTDGKVYVEFVDRTELSDGNVLITLKSDETDDKSEDRSYFACETRESLVKMKTFCGDEQFMKIERPKPPIETED